MPPPPTGIFDPFVEPAPTPAPAPAPAPAPQPTGVFDAFVSAPKPPPTLGEQALGYAAALPVSFGKAAKDVIKAGQGIADLTGLASPEAIARWRAGNAVDDAELNALVEHAPGAQTVTDLAGLGLTFAVPGGQVVGPTVFGGERAYDARAKGLSRPAAAGLGVLDAASSVIVPGAVEAAGERFLAPALGRAVVDPIARAAIEHATTGLGLGLSQAAVSSTYDPQRAAAEAEAAPWFALGAGAVGAAGARLSDTLGATEPSPPMGRVETSAPVDAPPAETPAPTGVFDKFVGSESAAAEPAPAAAPERTGPFQPGPRVVGPTVRGVEGPRVNGPKVQRRGFGEPEPAPVENPPAVENPAPAEPGAMTAYRQQLAALTPDERVALAQDIAHVGGANPPDPVSALAGIRQALELRKPRPERQIAEPADTLSTGESSHEARQPEVPEAVREGSDVPQGAPGESAVPGDAAEGRVVPASEGEGPVPAGEGDAAGRLLAFDEETRQQRIASQKRINELRADARANPGPNAERSRALDTELKRSKGDAFSRAAKRRALVQGEDLSKAVPGGLTAKELAAARVDAVAKKGRVTTLDGPGYVVSTPFGKVRVKLESGETKTYERAQVQRTKEPADAGRGRVAGSSEPAPAQPAQRAAAVLPEAARTGQPKPGEPVAVPAVGADRAAAGDGAGAGRRTPDAGGPVVEPAANQRATSTRPDLAIPSDQPAAREVFKEADARRTAAGQPEVVSRASTREAAAERLSSDAGGELARIRDHVTNGGALSAEDAAMLHALTDRYARAGDSALAGEIAELYRRGKGEGARATGYGADPLEPPGERIQHQITQRVLEAPKDRQAAMDRALAAKNKAEYDKLLQKHLAAVAAHEAELKRLTGIDPHDLAGDQAKPAKRGKLASAKLNVDREFTDLKKQLKDAVQSALKGDSVGAMGGEVVDVLTKMIVNRLKKGAITAAEMAATLAHALPELRKNAKLQAAFKDAWNSVKKDEPIGDAGALFKPSIADQVEAAKASLDRALERHAAAFGQTPEERLAALDAKEQAKQAIPPEVAKIRAEARALDSAVRARDRLIARNGLRIQAADNLLKADGWDKFDEGLRLSMHTSLGLPWYKLTTDAINKLHSFIADDVGAAIINHVIPGGKDPRSLSDVPLILKAIIPSLAKGAEAALDSIREDRDVFADEVRAAQAATDGKLSKTTDEFQYQDKAIKPGVLRTLIGWNMRLVSALNAGARSLFAHAQVGAEAHRLAFDEAGNRLTGEALHDFMRGQVEDVTSPAWTNALKGTDEATSTTPLTARNPVYWLNRAKNAELGNIRVIRETPGAYPVLRTAQSALRAEAPFTVIPTNIIRHGIYGMTPLNGASIAIRTVRAALHMAGLKGGAPYARAQFNKDLARHVVAWMGVAAITSAMRDKDGKRRLTGYAYDPSASDRGQPPAHSVLVDGKWWDYGKLFGSAAHAIGSVVDALDAIHSTNAPGAKVASAEATKEAFSTLKEHVVDETLLRGVADLAAAARSSEGFGKYIGTLASELVPTQFKQASKATEDERPSHRAKADGLIGRAVQTVRQQVGIDRTPAVDVFGKDIPKDDMLNNPVTSALARLLAPAHGQVDQHGDGADKYRALIQTWNDQNPGDKLKFGSPEPWVTIDRKRVDLTDQQYHDFCVDAGKGVLRALDRAQEHGRLNTEHPTDRDAKLLRELVTQMQAVARDRLRSTIARESRSAGSTAPR